MKKISDEIKNQVISLRKEGKTYQEIMEIIKIGKGSISNICKQINLEIKTLTDEQIKECQNLYNELGSISKVKNITGISVRQLSKFIQTRKNEFCLVCGKKLVNRQTMFCSKECKLEHYKINGKSYNSEYSQKKDYHGLYLKYKLIKARGGKCEKCGYNKNISALQFHHIDPSTKKFTLDARTLERTNDKDIIEEFNKCQLLCSNCHAEIHHPDLNLENYQKIKELGEGIKYRTPHDLEILD